MQREHLSSAIVALLCSLILSGCTGYSFSINDNPVYTPPSLFTDYQIADEALRRCVEQTIKDREATTTEQLTRLNCSSAGIETLEGLERFRHLSELNLANNQLQNPEELSQLSRLEVLVLSENQLESVAPLLSLVRLQKLDLSGNPSLACSDVQQVAANVEGEVALPSQCQ